MRLEVAREELSGGAVVLTVKRPLRSVYVLGSLPLGIHVEPEGREGLLNVFAQMLLMGTREKSETEIIDEIEGMGSSASFSARYECLLFTIRSTAARFRETVTKVFSYAAEAAFLEEELERLRGRVLTHLSELEQDPRFVAGREFRRLLFPGGHPYSRVLTGSKEGVSKITRDDLLELKELMTGRGAIAVVVGGVEPEDAVGALEEALEGLGSESPPQPQAPEVSRPASRVYREVRIPGRVQAVVVLGSLAVPRLHPDYQKLLVANDILGSFGLMGRLGRRVRAEAGLAYYVFSRVDALRLAGFWRVMGGFNPAKVEEAVSMILEELAGMAEKGVSERELEDSKRHLVGSMEVMMESPAGIAQLLLEVELYGLGLDYLERFREEVEGVRPEDVREVAEKYLRPEGYVEVVARP
ncbi:MAG: hypothetical protein DRK00_03775 [Thermoprotei archaeon]|nr:MAG: hypothetical protein DRK00_03775 [Thermoprotei archaeon]